MRIRILMLIAVALAMAGPASPAFGLTADEVRGGWIADVNGQRHVYLLNVRGSEIRGLYCWDCENPVNLAFVQNGKLETDSFSFVLLHDAGPGAPYRENVSGKIVNGRLIVSAQRQGSNARPTEMTMMREPRKPGNGRVLPGAVAPLPTGGPATAAPAPPAPPIPAAAAPDGVPAGVRGGGAGAAAGPRGRGYVAPGPNEPLTVAKISGLWLSGAGPNKQYFMFRQIGNVIGGLVCGPCDNPFTFGVLADGAIVGDTFKFNIVHEDWGAGIEKGPFNNQVTATISKNEMRIVTRQDNQPATTPTLDMTLLGPMRSSPP
jgi:hypothetical protein